MGELVKPIYWWRSTRQALDTFAEEARQDAGHQLHLMQRGELPLDWKALPSIGEGVYKIRLDEGRDTHRAVYVAALNDALYVLHCCQGKANAHSPQRELEIAQTRYQELMQMRKDGEGRPS